MSWIPAAAAAIPSVISAFKGGGGARPKFKSVSTLTKAQQPLHEQLLKAGMEPGAGGAYGTAADYYRDLLSNDSQTAQMMFAPEMRRFHEEIIPGLSEQFAGMGAGNLASSGFRNAAVGAGTDLSERLGAIRARLRAEGAQGLFNIGQAGLNPVKENIYMQGQPGAAETIAPAIGNTATQLATDWWRNRSSVGKNTSPYGTQQQQQNSVIQASRMR